MHLSSVQKLQAVLTAAATTTNMPVVAEWVDISKIDLPSFQTTTTNTNGLTIVDIVAAPAALIQRKINALTITNRDTATKTVEIYLDNNATDYLMVSCQLSVGDMLGYSDTRGWYAKDQFGCEKTTVQLAYSVVITALGFTPENVANKSTDVALGTSDTLYPSQNAVRTFVNNVAGGTSLDFFLSDTVSDIGTYYTLLNNPSPDAESSIATAIATNPTTVKTFATISTEPSITTLVSGAYTLHVHAAQTAGTKTSTIYANFYTRTSGGAETLRATSESSIPLSAINTGYDLNFAIPTDISINSTDRVVLEILGVPAGTGTTPTITLYMEGSTGSRIEFRTTSAANDTRYLVKNGLSGGQIGIGGLDAGDDLLFQSTSHATKGFVGFGSLSTGFIYDETNNRIGFGIAPQYFAHWLMPASDNLYIDARTNPREFTLGVLRIDHTPNTPSTRPINIDVICAGHADTHAINVDYHTTGIAAGDDSHVYDVHVDTANSTGGLVAALAVGKSGSGTVSVRALETYHGVEVLEQRAGTLTAIEQAWTYTGVYTDVTTAFGSAGTDVQIFASVNDYVYIGMAGTFDDIEIILATVASGAGIKPIFQYSAGASTWTTFTPVDGSNGFRTNGNISWTLPLSGWTTDTINAVTKYWVRIQRTQVTLATPPTEDTIKVFSSTYYSWDENGDIIAKSFAGLLTSSTGLPISSGVSGLGTGVATALAVNIGTAGAIVVNGGALGTPSSGVATNLTGTATGLTAGNATLAATVTVADAASDTTTWPMLATSQTGNMAPATDASLTYDASSNLLGSGAFKGTATSNTANDVSSKYGLFAANKLCFVDSTRTSNDKQIEFVWDSGIFVGRYSNDAYTDSLQWLTVVGGYASGITSITFGGANGITANKITASSATGGIGYKTGAGSTVAQATSKSTGVTLNFVTGKITMDAAALAAGAIVSFVLTNSAIEAEDQINCTHHATGTFGAYILNGRCAAGSATIDVTNISAGSLSEAIVIKYVLIKAVAA